MGDHDKCGSIFSISHTIVEQIKGPFPLLPVAFKYVFIANNNAPNYANIEYLPVTLLHVFVCLSVFCLMYI